LAEFSWPKSLSLMARGKEGILRNQRAVHSGSARWHTLWNLFRLIQNRLAHFRM
jgi:hypothetical protein